MPKTGLKEPLEVQPIADHEEKPTKIAWLNDQNNEVRTAHATNYLYRGFTILGVNRPPDFKPKYGYNAYALFLNLIVTILFPLDFLLSYMHMEGAELEIGNLLTSVQVAINVWGCSIKIIIMSILLKKLRSTTVVLDNLDARCTTLAEKVQIKGIIQIGNRFVILFTIAYWSYAFSTFLGSTLMGRPPYALYNPFFDWHKSSLNFWTQSVIELFVIGIACFQQVVDDAYPVIYVCILRAHIRIFMERIENLCTDANMTTDQNYEELKRCLRDHKNILELFYIISPIISITIFVQFTITAIILGTTLINILIFAADFSSRVASCFYVLAVVTEIFPLCYYSQCLMDDSDRLVQVIFHHNWVDQNKNYRKMLVFFMHRSQQRMELTAGKLFPITLNSFLGIAKFSFSLYTFINEMDIKEQFDLK